MCGVEDCFFNICRPGLAKNKQKSVQSKLKTEKLKFTKKNRLLTGHLP
jgi:hypothetical protein